MTLLDSDHLSVVVDHDHSQFAGLNESLESVGDELVATTIVSVEEQCRGWLARINSVSDVLAQVPAYRRLEVSSFFFEIGTLFRSMTTRPANLSDFERIAFAFARAAARSANAAIAGPGTA